MLSNHLSINLPKASINVTWGIFFWKEMVFTDQPTFLARKASNLFPNPFPIILASRW